MNDTRYLYEVRPVRPIVIAGQSIRRPCSIQLTKAEVMEYMKSASLYRRFANTSMEPIKVTGENLELLHQQVYNPNCKSVVSVPTFTVPKEKETFVTPVIEEIPAPVVEAEKKEDAGKKLKEEESSVISSEIEEVETVAEDTTEVIEDSSSEAEEEVVEEPVVEDKEEVSEDVVDETVVEETEVEETKDDTETVTEEETVEEEVKEQAKPVASINLKNGNNNHQKNNYNGKNKNNYKK